MSANYTQPHLTTSEDCLLRKKQAALRILKIRQNEVKLQNVLSQILFASKTEYGKNEMFFYQLNWLQKSNDQHSNISVSVFTILQASNLSLYERQMDD